MSDTDDTDVLLLIPPDFFLIHSDSDESHHETSHDYCDPHCGVVDTLITQVHQLENRLNKIETNTEFSHFSSVGSCNSTVIPMSEMSEHPYRNREYNEHYIPSSTKSTPQKPKSKSYLSSLPSTPCSERPGSEKYRRPPRFTPKLPSRIVRGASVQSSSQNQSTDESNFSPSPEKTDNKRVLGEIDQFLSNVKTIQKVSSTQHTEPIPLQIPPDKPILTLNDLKTDNDEAERRFSQLSLKDVNRLINQIESQQNFMDLRDQQVESLYENKNFQSWQCGDTKNSVPDLGFGMREILYSEENLPDKNIERRDSKSDSQSNSEQTYQTVFEKKSIKFQSKSSPGIQTNIPDRSPSKAYKKPEKIDRETDSSLEAYELPQDEVISPNASKSLPTNLSSQFDTSLQVLPPVGSVSSINLFSLADIWNSKGAKISDKEMKKLLPKLEEEKCRRKHCEKLIQELQMKILEMQQRLAVAVQVDSAKDEAILRFHEAWEKVANRWKSLESERNNLSQKLLSIEQRSSAALAEASQKVVQYELEMSKALDVARNSKEKASALEQEHEGFIQKIRSLKLELKTSHDNLRTISQEKEQLSQKISDLEGQALNDKKLLLETQNEVAKSKTVFLNCQNELSVLKDDYVKLEHRIKEKQAAIFDLETQKNKLQMTLDTMQNNEFQLQKQIKIIQDESERAKHDLRNFYQQQVEILVKDKLKEFQDQLENAEKSLQEELHLREQVIARTAAKQLQKLSDKHRLEVELIEEKHKEETRLYELQFNQMKQQIHLLESKLENYEARRTNIAQELHNIMEQQWLEALRIINKSPGHVSPHLQQQHQQHHQQQHQQQQQQQQNSNETLQDLNIADLKNVLTSRGRIQNFIRKTEEDEEKTEAVEQFDRERYNVRFRTNTEVPFRSPPEVYETPISSKHEVQQPDSDIQKYIKMLLEKLPKYTDKRLKEERKFSSRDSSTSDFGDTSSWHQLQTQGQKMTRELRQGKPPWK